MHISHLLQHLRQDGRITRMDHACILACYPLVSFKIFTSQTTTPPCLAGLRAWSGLFGNADCGQKRDWLRSAQTSSANLGLSLPTVVAAASFSLSQISPLKSLSYRSALSCVATFATFIPNIIVS